ncbi:OmpA family protein [Microbulbifer marinus]|uniref:Outer membrane protein OmpA n=1 Tax=Microbulbifer marinus TaxID=658218 RepID=A0A1H3YII2_9GAMM|nr:OmpA family protein [Microbulbifer marinus]SEA10712.1 Outer membrane protein OmpA [Microbulbifer marinus]
MADNLLDMAVRKLGSSGIDALTGALGLPADRAESAVNTGLATVIAGMLNKGSSKTGMASLYKMVSDSSDLDFSSIGDTFRDPEQISSVQQSGAKMLEVIFGSKVGSVGDLVSGAIGGSSGNGRGLLKVAAPVLVSLLSRLVNSERLDVSKLAALLLGQKEHIQGKLPDGLLDELGVSGFGDLGSALVTHGHAQPQEPRPQALHHAPAKKRGGFGKWFWPLLIALAGLYALNMCAQKQEVDSKPGEVLLEEESVIIEETPNGAALPPDSASDTQTTAEPATAESTSDADAGFAGSFREYLTNSARDPNREFPLNIEFAADSAEVTSSSVPEVEALAKILKENPGLSIAVEGHTSGNGDAMANQELSQRRADKVRQMLMEKGIDPNRVTATGMGSAKPVLDEGTGENGQKNERISVRVVTFE